jgi:hypothetical protein
LKWKLQLQAKIILDKKGAAAMTIQAKELLLLNAA